MLGRFLARYHGKFTTQRTSPSDTTATRIPGWPELRRMCHQRREKLCRSPGLHLLGSAQSAASLCHLPRRRGHFRKEHPKVARPLGPGDHASLPRGRRTPVGTHTCSGERNFRGSRDRGRRVRIPLAKVLVLPGRCRWYATTDAGIMRRSMRGSFQHPVPIKGCPPVQFGFTAATVIRKRNRPVHHPTAESL